MARTQITIPGTERKDHPDIEEACLAADEASQLWNEAGKKRAQKQAEVSALLKSRKLKQYKYWSERHGRHRRYYFGEAEPKLLVEDTDEGDGRVGKAVESKPSASSPDVHPGLIAMAERDAAANNVEETDDGDVTVPETAAPKAKRSNKPGAKAKAKK